jgi:hypothetical protein
MEKNKYQVWEGEMEAQHLEEREVAFLTVVVSSILGIVLFLAILCRTGIHAVLRTKQIEKRSSAAFPAMDC